MSVEPVVMLWSYRVSCVPEDHFEFRIWSIEVCRRTADLWAIKWFDMYLSKSGRWGSEPPSSLRDPGWTATHRFELEEALELAKDWAPRLKINNKTAAEVVEAL